MIEQSQLLSQDDIAITMNEKNEIETKWTITAPSDSYSSEETFDDYEDAYQYFPKLQLNYLPKALGPKQFHPM